VTIDVVATSSRIEAIKKCIFYLQKNNFLIFWDKRKFNKYDSLDVIPVSGAH
jgi:hypothetical protein